MTLAELTTLLRACSAGELSLEALREKLQPVITADPLDIEESDPRRWLRGPDEERLFWRLVYLIESAEEDGTHFRAAMGRVVTSLDRTRSAATTHEILPVLLDQPRFCAIVGKYRAGRVSRTGFLSVIAESGYPDHVRLWLRHASVEALATLCARLDAGAYDAAATAFEAPPE